LLKPKVKNLDVGSSLPRHLTGNFAFMQYAENNWQFHLQYANHARVVPLFEKILRRWMKGIPTERDKLGILPDLMEHTFAAASRSGSLTGVKYLLDFWGSVCIGLKDEAPLHDRPAYFVSAESVPRCAFSNAVMQGQIRIAAWIVSNQFPLAGQGTRRRENLEKIMLHFNSSSFDALRCAIEENFENIAEAIFANGKFHISDLNRLDTSASHRLAVMVGNAIGTSRRSSVATGYPWISLEG